MPTGGFGVDPRSLEGYAPASQWVIALFMAIAGANFALLYRAFVRRKPVALARDEEFRLYVGLIVLASAVLTVILWDAGISEGEEAVRQAAFQTVSIMTTTGFASTDFATWVVAAPAAAMLIVALMFPGGSAGSTAGSIKVVRHLVIGRVLRRELDQAMHPEYVAPGPRQPRRDRRAHGARGDRVRAPLRRHLRRRRRCCSSWTPTGSTWSSRPSTPWRPPRRRSGMSGPAFGFAGPMGSFEPFSDVSIGIMTGLMWLGRLEIVPVVALLTRAYWRA